MLHLRAFSQRKRILNIDAEVANRALDLRMAEQDLHGAEVSRLLVDDRRLGSAERMGAVVLRAQSDPGDPFVDEPRVLPRANMIGMINPAREGKVVESASSTFEPCEQTATGRLEELELNGAAGFLLKYDSS
jgi:hypothetical protein